MSAAILPSAEKRVPAVRPLTRTGSLAAGLLLLAGGTLAWGAPPPLPVLDQVEVNQAINKGIHFLRTSQTPRGTWSPNNANQIGYAALPGLTLLECGVPANDRQVQAAAQVVRQAVTAGKVTRTYEIALSILFLDRLGDARDRGLIHAMAARLIAGQTSSGGWSYTCPEVNAQQTRDILTLLHQLNPPRPANPNPKKPGDPGFPSGSPDDPLPGTGRDPTKPTKPDEEITQGSYPSPVSMPRYGWCIKMTEETRPDSRVVGELPAKPPVKPQPPPNVRIPPHLAGLPVFQDPTRPPMPDPPGDHKNPGVTDNSNTQFAVLALWAARRHGVPMDRSLSLVVKRFRTSQNQGGTWGYRYGFGGGPGGSPAMTCVGLLGLAIGHGIAQDPTAKEKAADDEMMKKGFLALYRMIGQPTGQMKGAPMQNLYFLWSVERVAVLYDMATLLDKDWYRWGAEALVSNQQLNGSWNSEKYPGQSPPIDTCLALLFLKRANLARDLTSRIPYNPSQLNEELIARLPTEPAPKPTPPTERPEEESLKDDPELFVGPPAPPSTPEDTSGIDRPGTPATASTPPATTAPADEAPRSNKKLLIFGLAFVVLLLLFGGVALFVMYRSSDDEDEDKRPRRRKSPRKMKKAARD